jgi:hypothetical protein
MKMITNLPCASRAHYQSSKLAHGYIGGGVEIWWFSLGKNFDRRLPVRVVRVRATMILVPNSPKSNSQLCIAMIIRATVIPFS